MERHPSRVARKKGTHRPARNSRYPVEDGGDLIECSGKLCRSCTAGLFADCVAVCCCPCSLVNLLALALVKVPWAMGRRCLGLGKRKLEKKRNCKRTTETGGVIERERNQRNGTAEEEMSDFLYGIDVEKEKENPSARFDADRIWLEFYQVGHLGFGRFSCSGIQPNRSEKLSGPRTTDYSSIEADLQENLKMSFIFNMVSPPSKENTASAAAVLSISISHSTLSIMFIPLSLLSIINFLVDRS